MPAPVLQSTWLRACVAAFSRSSATACSIEAFIPSAAMACAHWNVIAHCRIGATHGERPTAKRRDSAPTLWLSGHRPSPLRLAVGVVAWAKAPPAGTDAHLIHLLATLPARSVLVTDAGYIGYELLVAMTTAKVRYLIRMSSRATLFTEDRQPLGKWRSRAGLVLAAMGSGEKPAAAALRLLRLTGKKADVWLLTDVLISKNFRMRQRRCFIAGTWRNEGLFRAPTSRRSAVSSFGRAPGPSASRGRRIAAGRADSVGSAPRWNCVTTANRKRSTSACGGSWC